MTPDSRPETLLDELEALQDHVLTELDNLNDRILLLLKECTPSPNSSQGEAPAEPGAGIILPLMPAIDQSQVA